jgi:heptosyltransferase I
MKEILFIKTSSMGDILHHMPAVTEAKAHYPDARITWVVDELYAPLVKLHPSVDEIVTVAVRRWRKNLFSGETWREARAALRQMRARKFSAIIDTQGLMRTALMGRMLHGKTHGYDAESVREPFAARFYHVKHKVSWDLHVITRNRTLTARALGYEPKGAPDYGFDRSQFKQLSTRPYAMLFHATAKATKEWPEERWVEVGRAMAARGLEVVLPWGNQVERDRSQRLADAIPGSRVPERKPIIDVAHDIAAAKLVAGVDTGFIHIAAAIGVPVVAVFTIVKSHTAEPVGPAPIEMVGAANGLPEARDVIAAIGRISNP